MQSRFKGREFNNVEHSWWKAGWNAISAPLRSQLEPQLKLLPITIKTHRFGLIDTSALATTASSSLLSPILQAPTIKEQMPTKSSHLDYQHYQNDGEYVASMPKQYHSGEADLDNEETDEDFHGNALDRGPFFEVSATKNITAIAGHSAYLNCRVRNLGNRTVSLRELK